MPMTPASSPAAASATTQRSTSGLPGAESATIDNAAAAAEDASAPIVATTCTRRRGAAAVTTAVSAGIVTTSSARSSRSVTQAPQRGGVASTELGEDLFVEHRGDDCDECQVEGHAQLDRGRRSPRQLERRQREPVLAEH